MLLANVCKIKRLSLTLGKCREEEAPGSRSTRMDFFDAKKVSIKLQRVLFNNLIVALVAVFIL